MSQTAPMVLGVNAFERHTHLASVSAHEVNAAGEKVPIWSALCGDRAKLVNGQWQRLPFVNNAPTCKRCAKVDRAMNRGKLRVTLKAVPAPGADSHQQEDSRGPGSPAP